MPHNPIRSLFSFLSRVHTRTRAHQGRQDIPLQGEVRRVGGDERRDGSHCLAPDRRDLVRAAAVQEQRVAVVQPVSCVQAGSLDHLRDMDIYIYITTLLFINFIKRPNIHKIISPRLKHLYLR